MAIYGFTMIYYLRDLIGGDRKVRCKSLICRQGQKSIEYFAWKS